jgi:serine protease AprX
MMKRGVRGLAILSLIPLLLLSACVGNADWRPIQSNQDDNEYRYTFSNISEPSLSSDDQDSMQPTYLTPQNIRKILRLNDSPLLDAGFTVAVLDTGIYPHPDLTSTRTYVVDAMDFVNDIKGSYDDNGHGTAIAGIIHGIAPFVNLVSLKVLNYTCRGSLQDSIDAINWVIENKKKYNIRIINMSVAIPIENVHFDELSRIAEVAVQNGILVIASVGNSMSGDVQSMPMSPALGESIIAVGSARVHSDSKGDMRFSVSSFSSSWSVPNEKSKPDLIAPGENIISLQSDIYYKGDGKLRSDIGYTQPLEGTSEATAVVSGIIANLMIMHPSFSPTEIVELLYDCCEQIPGEKIRQGNGMFQYREDEVS